MIVIGADVGGTSMRAVLYQNGIERHRAEGVGRSMRSGEGETLAVMLADLVRPLLGRLDATRADVLVIGAAGAGREPERAELQQAVESQRLAWRTTATSDAELARLAAFAGGPGVLVIAGTGSIAIARDPHGVARRIGGLGWRMGDQGSAYWLGARGLEAVGAMHDHLGPITRLAETLPAAVGAAGIAGLVRWSVTATPAQVAALGPVVLQCADSGDEVARVLRDAAVEALVALAFAAGASEMPVAFSGGLLAAGRPLRQGLMAALRSRGAVVLEEPVDPCRGALASDK